MRLACYDAIFEQLDDQAPPVPAPAGAPPAPAPAQTPPAPAASGAPAPEPRVSQQAAQPEPRRAEQSAERSEGGFRLPRLWRRDESDDGSYTAVVVARYPLSRKRWILRTDGYELFESYEAQDWVPEVGERVTIDPATLGAGFTVKDAHGGARMKRLVCDGSSRRKETRRKCELLLDD